MIHGMNYVGGKFLKASNALAPQKTFTKINPSTEKAIAQFPNSNKQAVLDAVKAAREAQKEWRKLSRVKRAEYFFKLANLIERDNSRIAEAISLETGKTLNESYAEVNESLHMAQYTFSQGREPHGSWISSEIAEKDSYTFRKPKGVVAVIAPWNFPFAIGGFWTSAPALLEGNTVVFKPSEDSPYCGQVIAELYHEAGFPPGVFNTIHGDGSVGALLVASDIDHICFTGSASVGQYIRQECAKTWNKSCSCEMGSKSAVVVFKDAPPDLAIKTCVASAFKLSGQRCVSASRMLVHVGIFDEFCEKFVEATKKLKVGPTFWMAPKAKGDGDMGPLINKDQMERVLHFNEMTKGVTNILMEGKRVGDKGYFLSPHVYTCKWDDQYDKEKNEPNEDYAFLKREVFGPHVALIPFTDADDAVRIYNDTDYGLSLAVITKDMTTARYMRDNCDYGLGYHNLPCIGAESHLPFGGVKKSGSGGASAAATFRAVSHEVVWTTNFDQGDFKFCQGMQ